MHVHVVCLWLRSVAHVHHDKGRRCVRLHHMHNRRRLCDISVLLGRVEGESLRCAGVRIHLSLWVELSCREKQARSSDANLAFTVTGNWTRPNAVRGTGTFYLVDGAIRAHRRETQLDCTVIFLVPAVGVRVRALVLMLFGSMVH